jgi:hypothetical protein
MPHRKLFLIVLAVGALLPASASAAPTVTVTGDDGNPTPLNAASPIGLRQMQVTLDVSVPTADTENYNAQVFGPDNVGATTLSSCRDPDISPTARSSVDYRGNGAYTAVVRYFAASDTDCNGTVARETRLQYVVNAGTGVTPPPTRVLTRAPNSLVANTHELGVNLNPGAISYELRYARGGVTGPDGAITGPSAETFVNRTTGLAPFRFDRPGRYVIVGRARALGSFFTPWSAAVTVDAIAPFDIERVSYPDARGPSYKIRGQVRERAARGRVSIAIARGRKKGKFRRFGTAKINSKGRFAKRFRLRRTGVYRIRYTYRGSSLVAAGRVTQAVRIRRRIFF